MALRRGLALAAVGVLAVLFATGVGGTALDDIATAAVAALTAAITFWRAVCSRGAHRRSWLLVGAATTFALAGELCWGYYELLAGSSEVPSPSWADLGYLGFYPLVVAGLLLRPPRRPSGSQRAQIVLDGVLIAGSLFAVSTIFVLGPTLRGSDASGAAVAVSLAYPLCDVVAVTVSLLLIARYGADRATVPLAAGMLAWALGDSMFTGLTAGHLGVPTALPNVVYLLGYLLFAEAALCEGPVRRRRGQPRPDAAVAPPVPSLPIVPAVLAIGVGSWEMLTPRADVPTGVAVTVVLGCLLVRQTLAHHENRRLLHRVLDQQEELRVAAYHDSLTGLANRALFIDRLEAALVARRGDLAPLAVLMLDLDEFKDVNDTLGHPAGDALLRAVAARLRGHLRVEDTVARFGGDEFALLVEGHPNPASVASRVLRVLADPVVLAGRPFVVSASIGIAQVRAGEAAPGSAELLARADSAMYQAKRAGKSLAMPYTADGDVLAPVSRGDADEHDERTGPSFLGDRRRVRSRS